MLIRIRTGGGGLWGTESTLGLMVGKKNDINYHFLMTREYGRGPGFLKKHINKEVMGK